MATEPALITLVRTIAIGDAAQAMRLLAASPELARTQMPKGATREEAKTYFLAEILHYVYAGDTALHIAAAAYQEMTARKLLDLGADVHVKNRRGAEPLHYAVDGGPDSRSWNPAAQAAVITCLIDAGAAVDAVDMGGVTPLHRAVRNRCAAAVHALLERGADARRKNKNGSTPMQLAKMTTGRGGSGSAAAKAQQEEIVHLLEQHGAR